MAEEIIRPGYTRISDVASAFANYAKVPKNILDYTRDRGIAVHKLIYHEMNDLPLKEEEYFFAGKDLRPYIVSWTKWMNDADIRKIEVQETRYYAEDDKITGKPDLVALIDGKRWLVDWKCTLKVGKHWEIQAGGYSKLLREHNYDIDKIAFIKLDKEGGDVVVEIYNDLTYLENQFGIALHLYKKFMADQTFNLELD